MEHRKDQAPTAQSKDREGKVPSEINDTFSQITEWYFKKAFKASQ
jgi:hypothetical protein